MDGAGVVDELGGDVPARCKLAQAFEFPRPEAIVLRLSITQTDPAADSGEA
jgi:hypothetical protein